MSQKPFATNHHNIDVTPLLTSILARDQARRTFHVENQNKMSQKPFVIVVGKITPWIVTNHNIDVSRSLRQLKGKGNVPLYMSNSLSWIPPSKRKSPPSSFMPKGSTS